MTTRKFSARAVNPAMTVSVYAFSRRTTPKNSDSSRWGDGLLRYGLGRDIHVMQTKAGIERAV
jgi:hypothetical protein